MITTGFNPLILIIVKESSILDDAAVLDPQLSMLSYFTCFNADLQEHLLSRAIF